MYTNIYIPNLYKNRFFIKKSKIKLTCNTKNICQNAKLYVCGEIFFFKIFRKEKFNFLI